MTTGGDGSGGAGRRPTVGVRPRSALAANARLLGALADAYGVRFVSWERADPPRDALIVVGRAAVPSAQEAAAAAVPVLAVAEREPSRAATERVHVGHDPALDRRLRGLVLVDQPDAPALAPGAAETVLASSDAGPAWTVVTAGARVDRVRGGLPLLDDHDVLRQGLRIEGSLALLALVQMLRGLDRDGWTAPPLRATFLFDDPNLRRPRYGHIEYRRLLEHADAHGYHAAMAMIPLDVGGTHREAVAMFRDRPDRLSLVIHGNDHVHHELMQPHGRDAALALAAQALRRMHRFEAATGIAVDRVMTPPHGRCSRTVVRALGELGYDALCAIHPAPWIADTPPDRLLAGWLPSEFIDGCAVIPRFPFTVWPTEIALRAFLDQPLVLYGHHDDVAGGCEPLAVAAERVNALGEVRWGPIRELVRAGYELSARDGVAHVRPWSKKLTLELPGDAERVVVEPPPGGPATGLRGWRLAGDADAPPRAFGDAHPTGGRSRLDVELASEASTDPADVPLPRPHAWPIVRRRAAEIRDRLAALWPAAR